MSGTFNEVDVPPTLVSFAVDVARQQDIITPELKQAGNKLMIFKIAKDSYDLPVYCQVMKLYGAIHELIQKKAIVSAYALDGKGIVAAVSKMAFGNRLGVTIAEDVCKDCLFAPHFGKIIAEVDTEQTALVEEVIAKAMGDFAAEAPQENAGCGNESYCRVFGEVNNQQKFVYGAMELPMEEAVKAWTGTLEKVFPTVAVEGNEEVNTGLFHADHIYVCKHKVARPTVFIPVFPGTNCEYDSARAFERAGADTIVKVFQNLSAEDIRDSVEVFAKAIAQSQIIM